MSLLIFFGGRGEGGGVNRIGRVIGDRGILLAKLISNER